MKIEYDDKTGNIKVKPKDDKSEGIDFKMVNGPEEKSDEKKDSNDDQQKMD